MTTSAYLVNAADYEEYGVPLTQAPLVMRASLLIDHYLRRPEGCIWMPDAAGQPCYMAAKTPTMVLQYGGTISPGKNVVVPVTGYAGDNDSMIGDMAVLDRLVPDLTEACVVNAVTATTITLASVQYTHVGTPVPIVMEFGLSVDEQLQMPQQRSVTRLSQWPIARFQSGIGRYGYGRRLDQMLGFFYDANLLSTLSAFGGPPVWVPFSTPASSMNLQTGDLWVPAGTLLAYYTDIKVRYCAGWSASSLPSQIKVACAMLVDAMSAAPMTPQVRRFAAGKITIDRFANTVLDPDIKSMLRPYMANWMI